MAPGPVRRERKVVTVLFADLVGFTARAESLDPEDVEAILRPYHERLSSELTQRGGTVEKFVGDAVMAVFGAPVVHEDDPERAVRAAIAIRRAVVEDGTIEVRIAVHTGEALVNVDARPELGEAMVAGDVVNTASRLQGRRRSTASSWARRPIARPATSSTIATMTPLEVKGKAAPVPVWEVADARARIGADMGEPPTPLVGRERERALLFSTFERARNESSTQLVTIAGVPGIGKSRLVGELFNELERQAELTNWRRGRSLPYGEGGALWAFGDMVKAQAGILESDPVPDAERKLHEAVAAVVADDAVVWVEQRLRPLVGLSGETGARDESFGAWRRFVEALAEQRPTVLVFEDVHWANDELLDFIDDLVGWVTDVPLLVVTTTRPELFDRRPDWGGGKRNALTISLAPLAGPDTARLLAALLNQTLLPAEQQQELLARAGGNPLYAEQFARMFLERGEVRGVLPETVQGIITARLDSLPQPEKALLLDAAVLGRTFWRSALDGEDVDVHLLALQRKEFIRRERRSAVAGESEYEFAHLLIRDVAYAQMPRVTRAERHARAARWVDSLAGDRGADLAELRAHHYLSALELFEAAGRDGSDLVSATVDALFAAAQQRNGCSPLPMRRTTRRGPSTWPGSATPGVPGSCSRWPPLRVTSRRRTPSATPPPRRRRVSSPPAISSGPHASRTSPRASCGASGGGTRPTRRRSGRWHWFAICRCRGPRRRPSTAVRDFSCSRPVSTRRSTWRRRGWPRPGSSATHAARPACSSPWERHGTTPVRATSASSRKVPISPISSPSHSSTPVGTTTSLSCSSRTVTSPVPPHRWGWP